jgi:hypothetical protein
MCQNKFTKLLAKQKTLQVLPTVSGKPLGFGVTFPFGSPAILDITDVKGRKLCVSASRRICLCQ